MFEKLKRQLRKRKWFGYEWISLCETHQGEDVSCPCCQLGLWSKHYKTWEERQQGKATTRIPKGDYCYIFNGKNHTDKNGMPHHGVTYCPYHRYKNFHGIVHPYCDFLEMGDFGNEPIEGKQHQRLVRVFGSEDAMYDSDEFKLFLLWDGVKECGVNKLEDACCDSTTCIHKERTKNE